MDKSLYDDTKLPIFFRECKSNKNTNSLILAFTSHGSSGKWYDFYKVLNNYDKTHQLFLSSLCDKYYIGNIGCGWDQLTVTALIKDIIYTYKISKIITLGNSAAGTGAIVWGYRCAEFIKTSIIAGAPFNTIGNGKWNLANDICSKVNPKYRDNFKIYLDEEFKQDYNNNKPLFQYIEHIHVPNCKHNVMKQLYLSGDLFKLLDVEINSSTSTVPTDEKYWYCKETTFDKR